MWAMWFVSGIGVLLAALAFRGPWGTSGALLISIPFVALPLGSGLVVKYRLSRVANIQLATSGKIVQGAAAVSATHDTADQQNDFPLAMRPRTVHLTALGYLYTAGVTLGMTLVLWLLFVLLQGVAGPRSAARTVKYVFALLIWGCVLWSCVSFFRNRIREKRLFANGELSQGVVLTRFDRNTSSQIVYSYRDVTGKGFQNRATDFSKKLYEEMPIHIFYDSLDPRRSAVLESSLYRIH